MDGEQEVSMKRETERKKYQVTCEENLMLILIRNIELIIREEKEAIISPGNHLLSK